MNKILIEAEISKNTKIRLVFIIFFLILISLSFIVRLFYLQVLQHERFKKRASDQLERIINISAHRGNIYDRNGALLASNEPVYSIYAMPIIINKKQEFAKQVHKILNLDQEKVFKRIKGKRYFVWLKRKCSEDLYQKLKELNIKGIGFLKEDKRIYPYKYDTSHVIGFVGIDNQGLGGLEYGFDEYLKGVSGKIILERDPRGFQIISGTKKIIKPTQAGGHIYTTIDLYLQHITRKFLIQGIKEMEAQSGQAIILNPKTGDILSMVSYPDFDSNNWVKTPAQYRKNSNITDVYEPGSVFKIVTLASVLEEEIVTPGTIITVPETLKVGDRTIKEAHHRSKDESSQKTVSEILIKSLNVGTSLLSERLGERRFYKYMQNFGFGSKTKISAPGECAGILRPLNHWSAVDHAMMSFGQGIAVTPLQMITAVSVIANGGKLIQPQIIKSYTDSNHSYIKTVSPKIIRRVISKATADKVKFMMQKVVEEGTGVGVAISGYTIAGKTGTAQKPNPNGRGYLKDKYIASFVGFFPVSNPRVVILVIVDSPSKSIWGSSVAGPIFKNIAKSAIDYLNIPPDK